jgi:hypothetical protein
MLGERPFSTSGDSFAEETRRSIEALSANERWPRSRLDGREEHVGEDRDAVASGSCRARSAARTSIGSRSSARQIQKATPTRTNRLSDGVLVDNGFSPTERRASQERGAATIQEDLALRALPRTRRAVVRCDAVRVRRSRCVAPKGE